MDSTICHNESDGKFGKPLEEAKEAIAELRKRGYKIVIESGRLSSRLHGTDKIKKTIKEMEKWFKEQGIEVDEIPMNMKVQNVVKFDDRAITVDPRSKTCWADAMEEFLKNEDRLNKVTEDSHKSQQKFD